MNEKKEWEFAMTHADSLDVSESSGREKKKYKNPIIIEWGSLEDLTNGPPDFATDSGQPGTAGTF